MHNDDIDEYNDNKGYSSASGKVPCSCVLFI
jgi:hypothetical protein